jgi:outer membrane protein assembly factor BamB
MKKSMLFVGLLASVWCADAYGQGPFLLEWKVATAAAWPPTIIDDKVILKQGDVISAIALLGGKEIWSQKIPNLRYGEGVLTAGEGMIYVLGEQGVHLLRPSDGMRVELKKLPKVQSLLYQDGALYVSGSEGVYRFVAGPGGKLLEQAKSFRGEIRGVDQHYVALYLERRDADPKASPKRLIVVDLSTDKQVYEFKLLPVGWHRVIKLGGGRIVFIDYSVRGTNGQNSKKLYYTEADYLHSVKVIDLSLSAKYLAAENDVFWVAADPSGLMYVANHGDPGRSSALFVYDPSRKETLWTRSGAVASMGLILHRASLWTAVSQSNKETYAVAYDPKDGNTLFKYPLDSPGTGAPLAWQQRVLLRTRQSLYCFAPSVIAGGANPAGAGESTEASGMIKGWRAYRDSKAGYLLQTPLSWSFDKSGLRKLGGLRFVIPFKRTGMLGSNAITLGTLHIMTWEDHGGQARTVWNAVLAQQRKLHPDLYVTSLKEVKNVGGSGQAALLAEYGFRDPKGEPVQLRSLCLAHHGVAFELRGWASPYQGEEIWQDLERIFSTFTPQSLSPTIR